MAGQWWVVFEDKPEGTEGPGMPGRGQGGWGRESEGRVGGGGGITDAEEGVKGRVYVLGLAGPVGSYVRCPIEVGHVAAGAEAGAPVLCLWRGSVTIIQPTWGKRVSYALLIPVNK